ncbi:hypothetical protein ACN26Z_06480 [Verrucosispora sp. WMMD703]|uniref:Uncharacterized protein n=1 Tax=Micromonospora sediminimaris TaxID=547162 RepID=A0A9W5UP22_9ACTN|nr:MULTISPECIES: hypothetical protein [Micromonospora]WFE44877.1 hypothetical protein O7624_11295 [Verrucosispora sp. WMMD1129]GIJ33029.1 hypothetical protein Vse01_21770 [Micromonospora sediminimaris]SFD12839.1 hypothetical protein SAMN05216284_111139 [Micromonospora sediminimaris]
MRVRLVTLARLAVVAAVVFLVVLLVTGWLWRRSGARPTVDDGAVVHCLAAARRPALVDAARSLGLVSPESTVDTLRWPGGEGDLVAWRSAQPADFDRTCLALIAAGKQGGAGSGGTSPWSTLAPSLVVTLVSGTLAVVTGVLAAYFTRRLATAGARRMEAERLRDAMRAYRLAVEQLLRELAQPGPGLAPDDEAVVDRRLELAARLNAVAAAHPAWDLPVQISTALDAAPHGESLAAGWHAQRPPDRRGWTSDVRAALLRLESDVERVAQAIQEPGLFRDRPPVTAR